ncbi:MAG: hypothetical protein B6I24_04115 [Bacteroidetes bacterium 4572_128]|nr:MAG: hypothetical protein B6I24_04115 [Bacteroidetes bacterium 4572_128]
MINNKIVKKISYNFSDIDYKIAKKILGIEMVRDRSIFAELFDYSYKISKTSIDFFEKLIETHKYNISKYSEFELMLNFISPFLNEVHFFGENFRHWYQANLSGIINGYELSGKADFMLASGLEEAKNPYFFMSKFKKSKTNSNPDFHVLTEMAVAIEINKTNIMYGSYNIGKFWNFLILKKENKKYKYYESESFNSMKLEELKQIFIAMKAIKHKYCGKI